MSYTRHDRRLEIPLVTVRAQPRCRTVIVHNEQLLAELRLEREAVLESQDIRNSFLRNEFGTS
jgi:hypothetical protein